MPNLDGLSAFRWGLLFTKNNERFFRTKSFADDDEIRVLTDFSLLLEKYPDYNFWT